MKTGLSNKIGAMSYLLMNFASHYPNVMAEQLYGAPTKKDTFQSAYKWVELETRQAVCFGGVLESEGLVIW